MTNKLTKEKLDLLIEQMLTERMIQINVTDPKNSRKTKKELGSDMSVAKLRNLMKHDNDNDDLTTADLQKAFDKGGEDKKDAENWYLKTNHPQITGGSINRPFSKNRPMGNLKSYLTYKDAPPDAEIAAANTKYNVKKNSSISAFSSAIEKALNDRDLVSASAILFQFKIKHPASTGSGTEYEKAEKLLNYIKNENPSKAEYEKALTAISVSLGANTLSPEEKPLTKPNVQTQAASSGKFSAEIVSSFDKVFKLGTAANSLPERVERIGEISRAMMSGDANEVKNISFLQGLTGNELKRATLSCVMVLDYVAAITKYFDHGSGGYLFEAFCALITGGKVVGKGMGAGDFKLQTPSGEIFGSSKYYQKGSVMSQSLKDWPKETVTYIVAQKEDTSDPDELVNVGIHIGEVLIENENIISYKGNLKFYISGTDLKIESMGQPNAVVKLATDKTTSFQESLQQTMDTTGGDLKKAFNMFKEFLQLTAKTDELTKKYIDDGETTTGNDALSALEEADLKQTQLLNAIRGSGQAEVGKIGSDKRELGENKTKSKKELDKLIEGVILNKMNKL